MGFVGATDSAAPFAIILHAARAADAAITRRWRDLEKSRVGLEGEAGLQIVFFDGEEAFGEWTSSNSLYGSRALADAWAAGTPREQHTGYHLDDIELFVLLDLLGGPTPRVPSFFRETHSVYQQMSTLEGATA